MAVSSTPDVISLLDSLSAFRHPFVPLSSVATYSRYSRCNTNTCQPRRNRSEREALRQRKVYQAPYRWEKNLQEGIEKDATYSRKKEVSYLRQWFLQFNKDEDEQEYIQTFNVSHQVAPAKHPTP